MSSLISTAAKPIDELTIYYLRKQDDSQRIRILEAENGILEAKNENMRLKLQLAELGAKAGTGNLMGRAASTTGAQSIPTAAAPDKPYFCDQVSKEVSKLTMQAIKDGHFLMPPDDICTLVFNGLDKWASLNDPQYLEGRTDYVQQWWTHKAPGRQNASGYSLWRLKFSDNGAQKFKEALNDYIQVASGVPRPVRSKGTEAVEAQVTAHAEWCRRILNTGPDGRGYRRQSDAADNTAFVVSLGNAFDKTAIQCELGNRLVLITNLDGSCKKPCVTLEQLAAFSFKMKDRLMTGAGDVKPGVKECHLQPMRDEAELLRTEILNDAKPLSRILIKTDDEELLAVLGDSGVCSTETKTAT